MTEIGAQQQPAGGSRTRLVALQTRERAEAMAEATLWGAGLLTLLVLATASLWVRLA